MNPGLTWAGVSIDHPGESERARGATSTMTARFFTPSGQVREVELTPEQALKAVHELSGFLITLSKT